MNQLKIQKFVSNVLMENGYVLYNDVHALVIDPGNVYNDIVSFLKQNKLNVLGVLLTHGHFDHIAGIRPGGNPSSAERPQIVMHKADLGWLEKANQYMPMFGMPSITIPKIDIFVQDGDILNLGNMEIKVIHTPGHTQGGVCYLADGKLFSGDTIFREAVGRCDLEGGDFDQIVESIENKIFTLPPETLIYPGHGRMTSVEWEKEHNRFM